MTSSRLPVRPTWIRPSVEAVDFAALAALGRDAVLIDLDNTLAGRTDLTLHAGCSRVLLEARAAGLIRHLCVVSNTGMGWHEARVASLARLLDAECICARWWELKPAAAPFQRALQRLSVPASQAVMIGDQVFTDVVGANRLGIMTVLVEPLGPDGFTTRLTGRRARERRLREAWALEAQ